MIKELFEPDGICDRQGCNKPVKAYVTLRGGAVGLCEEHARQALAKKPPERPEPSKPMIVDYV